MQLPSGVRLTMGPREGIVVAIADWYHGACLQTAFVNGHVIAAATTQMGGQLYNASRAGVALVVTAATWLTVVWNNLNYQTVRGGFHRHDGQMAQTGKYAGMYLGDPDIDFVQLAASQGVQGERATTPTELAEDLKRGTEVTASGEPYVVEAMIRRIGAGAESTWHEGFKLSERMQSREA